MQMDMQEPVGMGCCKCKLDRLLRKKTGKKRQVLSAYKAYHHFLLEHLQAF